MINTWRLMHDGLIMMFPIALAFFVGFIIGVRVKPTEKEKNDEFTDTK